MKHALSSLLVATALVAPAAFAQTTATTKPVGYVTQTLKTGQYNLIGLTLHEGSIASGAIETVSGAILTDNDVNFGTTLTANATYVLEITSGPLAGNIQEITTWSGNTLTAPQNLQTLGMANGTTYVLRKAKTISDVFGAENTANLQFGASATLADIIYVPNSSGAFDSFYYSKEGFFGTGWRKVGGNSTDYANFPLVYSDAIMIYRRGATDLNLTIAGEVKTGAVKVAINSTFTYVGGVYPVGSTLDSSKLKDTLHSGASATLADKILVPNASGGFDSYYYSQNGFFGDGWRKVNGGTTDYASFELPSGFIIQRAGTTDFNATITPPASYNGL